MSQQGQSLPCNSSFATQNKKISQNKKEGKNIFKSSLSPSPLCLSDAQQSWKKREKEQDIFRGGKCIHSSQQQAD